MNSKIKVDNHLGDCKNIGLDVVFLLCMVCNMTMQAKAYESFKVSIYVRAYEVDKMKDIHWLDSTWNVISQQLEVDKIYLETHRDLLVVEDATLEQAKKFFHDRGWRYYLYHQRGKQFRDILLFQSRTPQDGAKDCGTHGETL